MNTKTTFILFGQAGQNVAQGDARFGRRLRKAFAAEYTTKELASAMLMRYAFDEGDNYSFTDDGSAVRECISFNHDTEEAVYNTIIERGGMCYEHDSRTWEFIALDELDEKDAEIVLRDNVLFSESDKEAVYEMYPDLRPVEEDEDA